MKIQVLDIFCGMGGLGFGFHSNEKFNIVLATDIEKTMCETYKLNNPNTNVLVSDIKDLTLNGVKIDVIIGGPPCQAYSTIGKRLLEDPRAKLFQEFFRIVKETKPKVFLFENVKGLLSIDKGNLFKNIIELFESIDYKVKYEVLNAANYNIPQTRERVFIVGVLGNNNFEFPIKNKEKNITLKEAIGDLPELGNNESISIYTKEPFSNYQKLLRKDNKVLTEHKTPNNNKNIINLMRKLKDGQTPLDLPKELRPKSGFKNTYSKLWWDRPCTTITRMFSSPSSSRCIHPIQSRPLTTREALRIQSFPDSYKLTGSETLKKIQVGNAVPPILSVVLAKSIEKLFE